MVLLIISSIAVVFDLVETIRRSYEKDIPFHIILEFVSLKIPRTIIEVLPFTVLIGTIFTFTKMSKNSELVIARSTGSSVFEIMLPSFIVTFLIGVFVLTLFNPLSALMLDRYEKLESKYWSDKNTFLSVSSSGLWLRELGENKEKTIINAANIRQKTLQLIDVTFFQFSAENKFERRIDAETAVLKQGYWEVTNAKISVPKQPVESREEMLLKTKLVVAQLQDSFSAPETISFWELPHFISNLKQAGFSAIRHKLHYYELLLSPLFLVGMAMVATYFSMSNNRRGKVGILIFSGIVTGFLIYFLANVISAMGLSEKVPVFFAAFAPVGIMLAIGSIMILHIEKG